MTHNEMMTLKKGDLVTVTKSGKTYRCDGPFRKTEGYREDGAFFYQQRNGKDYGPIRPLKAESIERAEDDGSHPVDMSVQQQVGRLVW